VGYDLGGTLATRRDGRLLDNKENKRPSTLISRDEKRCFISTPFFHPEQGLGGT
jgi:hypothetical protein